MEKVTLENKIDTLFQSLLLLVLSFNSFIQLGATEKAKYVSILIVTGPIF